MKKIELLITTLFVAAITMDGLAVEESATAEAHAEASSSSSSSYKKTVTVTSDGKNTIKKIVEVIDGVEHVTTEITDENGKVTVTPDPKKDNNQPDDDPDGPWLGVRVKESSEVLREQLGLPEGQGAVIEVVAPDGPADKVGIRKGDILLTLADKSIASPDDLSAELQNHKVGETVKLEVMRRGKTGKFDATLEERPADQASDNPPKDGHPHDKDRRNEEMVEVEIEGAGDKAELDKLLNDPNLPDDFKDTVKEMKKKMEEFERKHGNK